MSVAWLCPTLHDPMDRSPPGSPVHEIPQASILEWVAIPFSRGSSPPRDKARVSCKQILYQLSYQRLSGNEPTCQCKSVGSSLNQEDPLAEAMATHSSVLAWRIPWTEGPGGLQSMASPRVGHDLETKQQQESEP